MDSNNKDISRLIAFRARPSAQRDLELIKKKTGANTTEALHQALAVLADRVAA